MASFLHGHTILNNRNHSEQELFLWSPADIYSKSHAEIGIFPVFRYHNLIWYEIAPPMGAISGYFGARFLPNPAKRDTLCYFPKKSAGFSRISDILEVVTPLWGESRFIRLLSNQVIQGWSNQRWGTNPCNTLCNLTIASVSILQYSSKAARFLSISPVSIFPCAIIAKVTSATSPFAISSPS